MPLLNSDMSFKQVEKQRRVINHSCFQIHLGYVTQGQLTCLLLSLLEIWLIQEITDSQQALLLLAFFLWRSSCSGSWSSILANLDQTVPGLRSAVDMNMW